MDRCALKVNGIIFQNLRYVIFESFFACLVLDKKKVLLICSKYFTTDLIEFQYLIYYQRKLEYYFCKWYVIRRVLVL